MAIVGRVQLLTWGLFLFTWRMVEPSLWTYFVEAGWLGCILLILLLIPIHELFHAVVYPLADHKKIVIGLEPKMGVFFAMYYGPLSRNRWLLVYLLPFLLISILPLVLIAFIAIPHWWLLASIFNAGFAAGDLFGFYLILRQVPVHSVVMQDGWDTYWQVGSDVSLLVAEDSPSD